jgi:uncharacterized protein (TIGR02284 family)
MKKENTINKLNRLLIINNDRIEGYETASDNTEESALKTLFSKFAQTSQKCRHELIREIDKIGGKAEEGSNLSGKFFRTWMDVKSSLTGKDRKAILNSCDQGEERAIETYKNVLKDESEHLNSDQKSMIRSQYDLIKTDQGKIRTMQNALVAAS